MKGNCGGSNNCADGTMFTTNTGFQPTSAMFQIKRVGTITASFAVGIWASTTQVISTALPSGNSLWDNNAWLALSNPVAAGALSTSAFTNVTFTFTNAKKITTSGIFAIVLLVHDNSTKLIVATNGFFNNFATGVGANFGGDGSCQCQEVIGNAGGTWNGSGNADVPIFELDGLLILGSSKTNVVNGLLAFSGFAGIFYIVGGAGTAFLLFMMMPLAVIRRREGKPLRNFAPMIGMAIGIFGFLTMIVLGAVIAGVMPN